jgi:hypothetical protein
VDGWGEDVVGFDEPGEEEKDEHDSGGPAEELQRECGGEGRVRVRLRFSKDEAAEEADSGRECEEEEGVDDAVAEGLWG